MDTTTNKKGDSKEIRDASSKENNILKSVRDKQIFFDALAGNESEPNEALVSAIKLQILSGQ